MVEQAQHIAHHCCFVLLVGMPKAAPSCTTTQRRVSAKHCSCARLCLRTSACPPPGNLNCARSHTCHSVSCVHTVNDSFANGLENLADIALKRGDIDLAITYTEMATYRGSSAHLNTNLWVRHGEHVRRSASRVTRRRNAGAHRGQVFT